jgi:hypothetical protein
MPKFFSVNAGLKRDFDTAFGPARAGAKQVVGCAVFLHDDDDVLERSWWKGLGVGEGCRERHQKQ